MKKDPNLYRNEKILIDGVIYEKYTIESVEWNLQSNVFSVKVSYYNQTDSKKTARNYPLQVGGDVNINEVIETIHTLHKKFLN
jgi:hypothetical protein